MKEILATVSFSDGGFLTKLVTPSKKCLINKQRLVQTRNQGRYYKVAHYSFLT